MHRVCRLREVYAALKCNRIFLMVQRLNIRLPVQGTQVQTPVQEDSTCCEATKPICPNYWACALEPERCNYWSPRTLEPMVHNKRSHHHEKPGHSNWRKLKCSNKDPVRPKMIFFFNVREKKHWICNQEAWYHDLWLRIKNLLNCWSFINAVFLKPSSFQNFDHYQN